MTASLTIDEIIESAKLLPIQDRKQIISELRTINFSEQEQKEKHSIDVFLNGFVGILEGVPDEDIENARYESLMEKYG
ncbi:MAG: hypothetical protein LBU65_05365 [Planctomycetaceae bacterium]|jgi:hypothetical protein|nr:hypothetical protein [Planctomycetaceae bacterium]